MKQRVKRAYWGIICLMVALIGAHLANSPHNSEAELAGVVSVITDANHERNYLSERAVNTALIPEVSYSLAPSVSRTSTGRQRTSVSNHSHDHSFTAASKINQHEASSGIVCCGHLYTSRSKDFYVFALRHIII